MRVSPISWTEPPRDPAVCTEPLRRKIHVVIITSSAEIKQEDARTINDSCLVVFSRPQTVFIESQIRKGVVSDHGFCSGDVFSIYLCLVSWGWCVYWGFLLEEYFLGALAVFIYGCSQSTSEDTVWLLDNFYLTFGLWLLRASWTEFTQWARCCRQFKSALPGAKRHDNPTKIPDVTFQAKPCTFKCTLQACADWVCSVFECVMKSCSTSNHFFFLNVSLRPGLRQRLMAHLCSTKDTDEAFCPYSAFISSIILHFFAKLLDTDQCCSTSLSTPFSPCPAIMFHLNFRLHCPPWLLKVLHHGSVSVHVCITEPLLGVGSENVEVWEETLQEYKTNICIEH